MQMSGLINKTTLSLRLAKELIGIGADDYIKARIEELQLDPNRIIRVLYDDGNVMSVKLVDIVWTGIGEILN